MTKISKLFKQKAEEKLKPKPRKLKEIQQEFNSLLMVAGEKEYTIKVFEAELQNLYVRISNVNSEGAESKKLYGEQNEETETPLPPVA